MLLDDSDDAVHVDPLEALKAVLPDEVELTDIQRHALNEALYTVQERHFLYDVESIGLADALRVHALVQWALSSPTNDQIDAIRM